MADWRIGSVKYWSFGRRESTSVAKLLWPMLSWVQGNSRLCIWRRRTNISCVKRATCVVSRDRCLTACCLNQQHRSPGVGCHSIVSGNFFCSPGAGPSVYCLQTVFLVFGGRLRWIVQQPSSPSWSSSSRDVFEWRQPKCSVIRKQWRSTSSEDQQRREDTSNPALLFLGG